MHFRFAVVLTTATVSATAVADAKMDWHLYGAVPVAGDRTLELAYSDALSRCRLEGYRPYENPSVLETHYNAPEMRSCLYRKGFVYQNGQPHAYPVPKVTYKVR